MTVHFIARFYQVCSNGYLLIDTWQREERDHKEERHILKCLRKNVHEFFHLNFKPDLSDGIPYV